MRHDEIEHRGRMYGDDWNENDILEIYLDLDDLTLSFAQNGKDCGVAFENIDKCQYRVAVWMYGGDTGLEYIPDDYKK